MRILLIAVKLLAVREVNDIPGDLLSFRFVPPGAMEKMQPPAAALDLDSVHPFGEEISSNGFGLRALRQRAQERGGSVSILNLAPSRVLKNRGLRVWWRLPAVSFAYSPAIFRACAR